MSKREGDKRRDARHPNIRQLPPLTDEEAKRTGAWLKRQLLDMDAEFCTRMAERAHAYADEYVIRNTARLTPRRADIGARRAPEASDCGAGATPTTGTRTSLPPTSAPLNGVDEDSHFNEAPQCAHKVR